MMVNLKGLHMTNTQIFQNVPNKKFRNELRPGFLNDFQKILNLIIFI